MGEPKRTQHASRFFSPSTQRSFFAHGGLCTLPNPTCVIVGHMISSPTGGVRNTRLRPRSVAAKAACGKWHHVHEQKKARSHVRTSPSLRWVRLIYQRHPHREARRPHRALATHVSRFAAARARTPHEWARGGSYSYTSSTLPAISSDTIISYTAFAHSWGFPHGHFQYTNVMLMNVA